MSKSKLFKANEKEEARKMVQSQPSSVIKPLHGLQARGVTIGVETDQEFDEAWDKALNATKNKEILVEENFQNGILGRYLVVDGKCVAVSEFTKPFVIGNGKDSIEELIYQKNEIRKANPHLRSAMIKVTDTQKKTILSQGYNISSILEKGKKVVIDHRANPQVGSDTIDITDIVHPLFKKVAEAATNAIPGLYVAGIDVLAHDHTIEPKQENYRIIEVNNRAGMAGHLYPMYGNSRNVIEVLGKHLLKTARVNSLINNTRKSNYDLLKSKHNKINLTDVDLLKQRNNDNVFSAK